MRLFSKATALGIRPQSKAPVRVNSVHPGFVETPLLMDTVERPMRWHPITTATPLGRLAQPGGDRGRRRFPRVGRCELHDRIGTGGRWRLYGTVEEHKQMADVLEGAVALVTGAGGGIGGATGPRDDGRRRPGDRDRSCVRPPGGVLNLAHDVTRPGGLGEGSGETIESAVGAARLPGQQRGHRHGRRDRGYMQPRRRGGA